MKEELALKTLQSQGIFKNSELSGDTMVTRRAMQLDNVQIAEGEERTFTAKATSPIVDREGEYVVAQGMEVGEYLTNPVLCWNHTYSTPPVGKAVSIDPQNGMITKFQMAATDFAKDLWELVKDGMINNVSAGFLRKEIFKRGQPGFTEACRNAGLMDIPSNLKQICTKSVLVEISLCCMGVNRGSMILAVAAKGLTSAATQLGVDLEAETDTEGEAPLADSTNGVAVGAKPLPNEHAARQENPDHFHRFRRMNNIADGVSFIVGFDDSHKTKVQSVRFSASKFTPEQAKEWLKKHKFSDSAFVEATGPTKTEATVDGKKDEGFEEAVASDAVAEPPAASVKETPAATPAEVPAEEPVVEVEVAVVAEPVAAEAEATCPMCNLPMTNGTCSPCMHASETTPKQPAAPVEAPIPVPAPEKAVEGVETPPVVTEKPVLAHKGVTVLRRGHELRILRVGRYMTTSQDLAKAKKLMMGKIV